MGPALREAWLWLLLAFVLGVVIGYFLRRYTVAEDAADAAAPEPDESLAKKAEHEIAEAERADAETAEGDAPSGDEPEPRGETTEADGAESKESDSPGTASGTVDLSQEERELLEKDAAAFHALAQLSQGQLTDSHGVTRVVPADDVGQAEEVPEEQRSLGEAPPEQHVDTHQTFMPVVEPLRVPGGRSQLQPAQSTPERGPEVAQDGSVEAETPADGAAAVTPTAPDKGRKPRRRDS